MHPVYRRRTEASIRAEHGVNDSWATMHRRVLVHEAARGSEVLSDLLLTSRARSATLPRPA